MLLTLHAVGVALIILSARRASAGLSARRASAGPLLDRLVFYFRNWYPILFVACCYRPMSFLILDIRHTHFDQALAELDRTIWGAYPTVWLERIYSPILTESLQIIYTLFLPAALFVP